MSVNTSPKTIDEIFGSCKYYIDFYQRDYKWVREHIEELLDDIFYKFENEYKPDTDASLDVISKYDWYYLNIYVTNEYAGRKFIVDGQQRFTTITLILIKLYHLARTFGKADIADWLDRKICGVGPEGKSFWMGDQDRRKYLDDLFKNDRPTLAPPEKNLSISNLFDNYEYISKYLSEKLQTEHKFETFVLYFARRVILVEVFIENSEDVPMVFEVINDRGEDLQPYEVFKGELLGQLGKEDIDKYHEVWSDRIADLQAIHEKEADEVFRFYFRAKYVDKTAEYREFDGDYHKTVFSKKWQPKLALKRNANAVKEFISNDFNYYAGLYRKCLLKAKDEDSSVFYNDLNDQDRQYLLILSAVDLNDLAEGEKVELVSRLFDRHFTLLQILGCYDSNRFGETIIKLNASIRAASSEGIKEAFEEAILDDINEHKNLSLSEPLNWNLFRDANITNMSTRFIRYFFARIEWFIGKGINRETETETYYNLVRNTGSVNGYHVEHVLANNGENLGLFSNDEEVFARERNRLGAILLLKGRENISSGNEKYKDKLKTYSHATLWARTLTESFYHKHPDFRDFKDEYRLDFQPIKTYDPSAVEDRQRLLYKITELIWGRP